LARESEGGGRREEGEGRREGGGRREEEGRGKLTLGHPFQSHKLF
jgi:hypothetical protein